mmetsp:Transcript_22285/g.34045  ORF Transcript_22285/g.34045 Transcript_22285/m.34045 type:complete len:297 (+) Transcript_22285:61-951(+)
MKFVISFFLVFSSTCFAFQVPKQQQKNVVNRRKLLQGIISSTTTAIVAIQQQQQPAWSVEKDFSKLIGGGGSLPRSGGLANKVRRVTTVMDELQRDLMQERWDLVQAYPAVLRSYVPLFTTFTDSAYPSQEPKDTGLRVALRYEVGRLFASVERLDQATRRQALNEAFVAYSDMSLHFDRYLHVGGLYTYYDAVVSLEPYYKDIPDTDLVFADPKKDPALVRDLVVVIKGPDKGKTGIVIGIYPDKASNCVVKFDKYKGMREIRELPRAWVAKRVGEQDPDEVFLIPRKQPREMKT